MTLEGRGDGTSEPNEVQKLESNLGAVDEKMIDIDYIQILLKR